ncbi:aminotransferase class I/II-fold pyridoxal phosphate-dependent enzyme [Aquimarina intermedia]|uniref:8-amino-7-oxononanoate synthase n=1 Tax=Aquimarina intermedia TaxID=350814 RepID=A0A5S5CCN6_9FLAO|nr:aminotransferase class I/II-fold pyridoxal phosphate-dependent enzyme [Aquimarina intermedia]TYP77097.1 8-amino-7-oxononanoate synthase [Aquimarina intermedia]
MKFPDRLTIKLTKREAENTLRTITVSEGKVDFSSNDYLGYAKSKAIHDQVTLELQAQDGTINGATGSRLITGSSLQTETLEDNLAKYHEADSALLYNSGYDANIGFFSAVPQRGDVIIYDELIHASIRDGMQMSLAKAYKYTHNDLNSLEQKIIAAKQSKPEATAIYVVTESVFSMDGDTPDLKEFVALCFKYQVYPIIDEAHAVGVFGNYGAGLVQEFGLQDKVFARITTFGKAVGAHGAIVLGSAQLRTFLINFSRSFIYTTGLPPHSIATIATAYHFLRQGNEQQLLKKNIQFFKQQIQVEGIQHLFIVSDSAIQCCLLQGNEKVKAIAKKIQNQGYDVRAILSPTVPAGAERLRFCIHSYNSKDEITNVLNLLATFVREYAMQDHDN